MAHVEELYFISMAARELGLHPQTLRKYERLGLVRPSRKMGSVRVYAREEIERRVRQVAAGRFRRPVLVLGIDGAYVPSRPESARGHRPAEYQPRAGTSGGRGTTRTVRNRSKPLASDPPADRRQPAALLAADSVGNLQRVGDATRMVVAVRQEGGASLGHQSCAARRQPQNGQAAAASTR